MSSYPWLTGFLGDPRDTVAPRRGSNKDGRLPPLLVALTVVTGLVDAVSYLVLGHVFVANMTGNVVFFAFALADVGGFSATASVAAIGCFALGALAGALLVLHVHIVYPLVIALIILAAVAVTAVARARNPRTAT